MGELDISGHIESQFATQSLMQDLRHIMEQARGHVAATANYEQTMMYWHIGERINRDVFGNQRAEYGKQIVAQVARQLQEEYGKKGFDEKSIRRMMQFATLFPEKQIVAQLARKLFWSHFIEVLPLKKTPLGLLLCTEGSEEQIELLQLDKAGIKMAQYMTELPPRAVLQHQIQKSLAVAKARLANY